METTKWLLCLVCGRKTHNKIREDTEAKNFPVTAINIYLKKLGREKRIPFEVAVDPFYSQENMTRLKESVAQMEATGGTVHEVDFDD